MNWDLCVDYNLNAFIIISYANFTENPSSLCNVVVIGHMYYINMG